RRAASVERGAVAAAYCSRRAHQIASQSFAVNNLHYGTARTLTVPASLFEPVNAVERRTYQQLARLGFRFEDLVKYNDYHAKEGPAGEVLNEVTWNKPDQYFAMVEKAYRTFYLRRDFVSDFKQLVAAGY
uniref:hypothetical protein n=1 Tax=Burkholderia gladioli TaxID=28095 RepID=UPI001FC88CCD